MESHLSQRCKVRLIPAFSTKRPENAGNWPLLLSRDSAFEGPRNQQFFGSNPVPPRQALLSPATDLSFLPENTDQVASPTHSGRAYDD